MHKTRQMSDTMLLGVFLAFAGGFMDAYSYILRDQVFANAQTGNMLLFGVYVSEGNFIVAKDYICPVLAFTMGIIISDVVHYLVQIKSEIERLHWRQVAVAIELVILFGVGFISQQGNLVANGFLSMACGIQVESFRKIHGNGIATTMCIGNLRSATSNLYSYIIEKKKSGLRKFILYFIVIVCFVFGAIIGNICIQVLQERAIWVDAFVLCICLLLMFKEEIEIEEKISICRRKN